MPEPVSMICLACGATLFAGISASGTIFSGTEKIVKKLGRRFGHRGHQHHCPNCNTGATAVEAYKPSTPNAGQATPQQSFYLQQNYYSQQNFYPQASYYGNPSQQPPLPPRPQVVQNLLVYCPFECGSLMSVQEMRTHVANCNNEPGQVKRIQSQGNAGFNGGGGQYNAYQGYGPAQITYPGYSPPQTTYPGYTGQQGYPFPGSPPPYYKS